MKSQYIALLAGLLANIPLVNAATTAATSPTEHEQYMLELLNRSRADPNAEVTRLSGLTWGDNPAWVPGTSFPQAQTPDLNEGLPGGTISAAAKQPLAFNLGLVTAARNHTQWNLQANQFSHFEGAMPVPNTVCWTGNSPSDRATAAGYAGSVGENSAVSVTSGSWSAAQQITQAENRHNDLFVDNNVTGRGHRTNFMNSSYSEIGIGFYVSNNSNSWGLNTFGSNWNSVNMANYNFGSVASAVLTGVVFQDLDADSFYTPNGTEALGGIEVLVYQGGVLQGSTTTFDSGGYSLDGLAAGSYDVVFRNASGETTVAQMVTIGSENVKVDAISPVFIPEPSVAVMSLCSLICLLRRKR